MPRLLKPSLCRIAKPEPQALRGLRGSQDSPSPTFMDKSWVLN